MRPRLKRNFLRRTQLAKVAGVKTINALKTIVYASKKTPFAARRVNATKITIAETKLISKTCAKKQLKISSGRTPKLSTTKSRMSSTLKAANAQRASAKRSTASVMKRTSSAQASASASTAKTISLVALILMRYW